MTGCSFTGPGLTFYAQAAKSLATCNIAARGQGGKYRQIMSAHVTTIM